MKTYVLLVGCVVSALVGVPASAADGTHAQLFTPTELAKGFAQPRATPIQHHHSHRRFLGCVRNNSECEHIAHDDHGFDHHRATHSSRCEEEHEHRHYACFGWND